jgi:GR25 family glycosyltransferase involved in LPS biosynthesis
MDWLPHMYILCNPQKEPIRYQFLKGHFEKRKLPDEKIHWVQGIWGSELTSEIIYSAYDPFHHRFGMKHNLSLQSLALSRGEMSLILTFYQAMRQILADGHDTVIVFESDVFLREDFLERLQSVLKEGSAAENSDWDYISLGEGVGTRPKDCNWSYFAETKLYSPPHEFVFRCCDSMLFRRKFLEKVVTTFLPVRECLDWEMNVQMMIHRGVARWADPPLVEPGTGRGRYSSSLPA